MLDAMSVEYAAPESAPELRQVGLADEDESSGGLRIGCEERSVATRSMFHSECDPNHGKGPCVRVTSKPALFLYGN